jgi:cytosine/adenosine deaminase-related metal-dependent hydrolase
VRVYHLLPPDDLEAAAGRGITAGFTAVAAWSARRENELGSIAAGKWADLTIYNQDLFSLSPDHWPDVETEMTVVHGEIVYCRAEAKGQRTKAKGQRTEVRGQMSEGIGQRSEGRGQRSENRCQRTVDRSQRSEDKCRRA